MPPVGSRREVLVDAALDVIGATGMRGLTHRAVDRQAGLPEGSCSAYFRTRQTLQLAAARRLVDLLNTDVEKLTAKTSALEPHSPEAAAEVVRMFQKWLADPRLLLGRLEFALEATRDDEIASVLTEGRERLVEVACTSLSGAGEDDVRRTRTLVAALDGLMLGALSVVPNGRKAYLDSGVQHLLAILPEATD